MCRKLGVSRAPEEVIEFVFGRAEGHPLFTEELSVALRDAGLLSIVGDSCYLSPRQVTSRRRSSLTTSRP